MKTQLEETTKRILLTEFNTVTAVNKFIINIEELESAKFKRSQDAKTKIMESIDSMHSDITKKVFNSENEKKENVNGVEDLVETFIRIKEWLKKLEVVNVTLVFRPSVKFIKKIHNWFIENVDSQVILSFKIDSLIGGGLVVIYKGLYLDLSLENRLSDYFTSNKDAVISKLQKGI